MSIDPEQFFLKIHAGLELTPDELQEITSLLGRIVGDPLMSERTSADDVYSLISILGRTREFQYRPLLEKCLERKEAIAASLILETLCLDWGFTDEYLEQVIHFALGVSWDEEEDVRQTALKILGEYLFQIWSQGYSDHRESHHQETDLTKPTLRNGKGKRHQWKVLELLLAVYDDQNLRSSLTRKAAYFALCRSYGKKWEEVPPEGITLNFGEYSPHIDGQLLCQLRSFLVSAATVSTCH